MRSGPFDILNWKTTERLNAANTKVLSQSTTQRGKRLSFRSLVTRRVREIPDEPLADRIADSDLHMSMCLNLSRQVELVADMSRNMPNPSCLL